MPTTLTPGWEKEAEEAILTEEATLPILYTLIIR